MAASVVELLLRIQGAGGVGADGVEALLGRAVSVVHGRSLGARLDESLRVVSVAEIGDEETRCTVAVARAAKVKVWGALTLCGEARISVVEDFDDVPTAAVRPQRFGAVADVDDDWPSSPAKKRRRKLRIQCADDENHQLRRKMRRRRRPLN